MDELAAQELEIHENKAGEIVPTLHSFVAGCAGGVVSLAVGQPFDTIKVRLQASTKFKGAIDCLRRLLATEGPLALFKGMSSPVLSASFVNAIVFTSYNETMTLIKKTDPEARKRPTYEQVFLAGSVAGALQCSVLTPSELIKCRLQTDMTRPRSQGLLSCIREVYREGGLRAFFNGFGPTLVRDLPAFGCYFALYEVVKDKLEGRGASPWLSSSVAGGFAGCFSWIIVYPVDVIKTVMQTQRGTGPRHGMLETGLRLWRTEGLGVFFRGASIAMVRALPVNCIVFPVYEWTVEFLGKIDSLHSTRWPVKLLPSAPDVGETGTGGLRNVDSDGVDARTDGEKISAT
ncbi:solute carrier family 25 member 45 [Nannochloropsis gaditana]|uniref:Solute carrier family 25 member 45 n=1 Tax=Nannochloropsis gaditana TaxID=72520 RepID=W7TZC0_9STRA|nr:solute carrier family 25 member 45 [Nannochloropsis gaditana]